MSYTIHDAIIVTANCGDKGALEPAREKAMELGLKVSDIVESNINGVTTFLIAPDGSKEGWPQSREGVDARAKWVAWARRQWKKAATPPFKGGAFLHFVHVQYGDTGVEDDTGEDTPEIVDYQPGEGSEK